MGKTSIEWTRGDDGSAGSVWNPVRGCSRISPGCGGPNHQGGCYAEKIAARFSGPGQPFEGFAERTEFGGRWTGKMALADDMLTLPLRWRKPRRIFVNSMSDLFHDNLPDEAIDKVFAVMALAPQHTYQVLTKRAARMRDYLCTPNRENSINGAVWSLLGTPLGSKIEHGGEWRAKLPLQQVWLGVSVEDQERADERIPDLLKTPAALRFLSCEPLLGPLDLDHYLRAGSHRHVGSMTKPPISLAIVGGESGPRSRPFWAPWARSILRQCRKAGTACFIKQMGANVQDRNDAGFEDCDNGWNLEDEVAQVEHDLDGTIDGYQGAPVRIRLKDRKGADMNEWPADLRVREMPNG